MQAEDDRKHEVEYCEYADKLIADREAERVVGRALGKGRVDGGAIGDAT